MTFCVLTSLLHKFYIKTQIKPLKFYGLNLPFKIIVIIYYKSFEHNRLQHGFGLNYRLLSSFLIFLKYESNKSLQQTFLALLKVMHQKKANNNGTPLSPRKAIQLIDKQPTPWHQGACTVQLSFSSLISA